jgi:hypothetical protein
MVKIAISGRLGSRFGFPVAKLVRYKPLLIFKLSQSFDYRTRICTGVHALNNEKVVTSARVVKKRALFFSHTYLLRSRLMASLWATRIAACSSRSQLSRMREKMFTPAVQGIKNAHLQQPNASVCGRKISLDPLS